MLSEVTRWALPLGEWSKIGAVFVIALFLFSLCQLISDQNVGPVPPKLPETIPLVSNSVQLATDTQGFWSRARRTMQSLNTEIVRFRIGGRRVYLVVGETKTNPLFRTTTGLTSHYFTVLFAKILFGPTAEDAARFDADVSGRAKDPIPGTEHIKPEDRVWSRWHHIFAEHLVRTTATRELFAGFLDRFMARTAELFPLNEPTEICIWEFLQCHLAECAGRALMGDVIFDLNPDYLDALADFDLAVMPVAFGPPRWLNPKPYWKRYRWHGMHRKFMKQALQDYNWDTVNNNGWDPVFGSPLSRSLVRWGLDAGFATETVAGMWGQQTSNQNSNSVPAAAWSLMSALTCPDPDLLPNLRREANAALITDSNGKPTLDLQKLLTSPWLQSVYTETLRMRVIFSVVREAERDTNVDGFAIPKGALIQAPIPLAHFNNAWAVEGHPPDEFWPQRHLTGDSMEGKEFSTTGRNGYWFPYGGGITMCPGRNFAKQEILATLALLLTRFEIEAVEWVMVDGTGAKSDREARDGEGFAVTRPDRDLKVRVLRKW
ncbi:cytochrome P450 [Immersiella caudata]|uniref:Cytochrome P450 n=1 Tax=Immersiella caudata TaxID=314043 RepID=A0AA39WZ48_9PEZI|nr:cytochrome P450 [Immersiella caudata]